MSEKNREGRPSSFTDPIELEKKIDGYFDNCDNLERPYTLSGLAVHLGTCRKTLYNYEQKDEFLPAIKRAKARIEAYLEEKLFGNNVTGVIFNLKNNYDWTDRRHIEGEANITVNRVLGLGELDDTE